MPRTATTEVIRARVRAEAMRLMAERGFEAMSVGDVAAAAGLSKQALLYHFPSKAVLRDEVLGHLLAHAAQGFPAMITTLLGDAPDRVDRALGQIQTLFRAEPHAARVLLRELLDGDRSAIARVRSGAEPWFRVVTDWIRAGQREGRIYADVDPDAAVAQLGTLVVASFALLPVKGWLDADARSWRERRLRATVRSIERTLFVNPTPASVVAPETPPAAPTTSARARARRAQPASTQRKAAGKRRRQSRS